MIGRKVSNYEIRRLIGEGEIGSVYLAEHPTIARKAAVKVLRRDFTKDQTELTRFFEEARALSLVRHPNIIDVIEVGRFEDGLPYLLMEYLEGETLRSRLRRKGRLPLADLLAIAGPLASALAAAHEKGFVHANLKPENVFIALNTAQRIKVMNFGMARLPGDQARATPAYLSPEQCGGPVVVLDARTDVYAVGTMLYEMLCGRPPFQGDGYGEVSVMQLMLQPTPPRSLAPEIPPAVESVILRTLSKAPADRYPSMNQLAQALAAAASARPATAPQPRPAEMVRPTPAPQDLQSVQGVIVMRDSPASVPVEPLPLPSMWLAPSLAPLAIVTEPSAHSEEVPTARLRGRRLAVTLGGMMALLVGVLVWSRWQHGRITEPPPAPALAAPAPPPAPAQKLTDLRRPLSPQMPEADPILDLPARPALRPATAPVLTEVPARHPRPALRPRARRFKGQPGARPQVNLAPKNWMKQW